MTTIVTGAAGHLGGHLVRGLLAEGRRVRVLIHRDRRAVEELDVEVVEGDLRDPASLRRAIAGAEVVYHAAGHISILADEWRLLEEVNVIGTRNVVEACLACDIRRLIHFSSIHALQQEPLDFPVDESRPLVDPAGSRPPYDRSKAAGELAVRAGIAAGLDAVILYPTAMIGPGDFRLSHQGEFLLTLAQGRMPTLVDGGFDWVDVRDVAGAALRADIHAPSGARYLLAGQWASTRELAGIVAEITGRPAPRFVCPMGLARFSAPLAVGIARAIGRRPLWTGAALQALRGNRRISHAAATRDLGYAPRPLRETLADTLAWFEQAGWLPPK